MIVENFFRNTFGEDFPGFISIWDKQSRKSQFFSNNEFSDMKTYIDEISVISDVYFGCGLLASKPLQGRGKSEDIIGIPGFWMDIDIQDPDAHKANNYPANKEEVFRILPKFPLLPTFINWSGYGLHVFWLFEKLWIFQDEDERDEALDLTGKFQDRIIRIFKDEGYTLDKTADLARLLRIPGTLNHKKEPAKPVKNLKFKKELNRRYTIDAIRNAIDSKSRPKPKERKPLKRNVVSDTFPGSRIENILEKCQWFQHCKTDAPSLKEPEWFFMLTVVSFCENPLDWAYELSEEYDGFDKEETREKVLRIIKTWTRPVSCEYISKTFDGDYCKKCTQNVKSPFELGIDKSRSALKGVGFIFDDKGDLISLNGNIFARYILHRLKLIYTQSGFFYQYYNGVWNRIEHNELSRILRNLVHEFAPNFWTKRREDLYIEALKREAPSRSLNPDRNIVNLMNGMLDLNELKFMPHTAESYSSIQLSINYDEEAKCPKFKKFLKDIFEGDKERIHIIQEIMGYCLTKDTSAQKAFFFYGQGSNGKSLLADIMLNLCGTQNTSAIPLEDLCNAFNRYELVDKLLNMTTENEVSPAGLNTAPFKTIVTGDPIQVEKKYEQSFMYRPFCKLVFSLNTLPYARDKSWGFQRRLLVIPFNRTFRETDPDYVNYNVLRTGLLEELPGILNFALRGLKRIRNNNYVFTHSMAIEELQTEYKQVLNPYSQFVAEMIEQGTNADKISNETIHRVFEKWCLSNGHNRLASSSHLKRLIEIKNALKDAKIDFCCGKGGGKRHISNIKLNVRNTVVVESIDDMDDFE